VPKEWQKPQMLRAILVGRRPALLAPIGLRDLAVGVFLFPGQVLVATRAVGNWRRPLLLLVLVGLACGLFTGLASWPRLYRQSLEWATWFGATVGEFRLQDDSFAWATPATLPHTTRCQRWRVDFAPVGAPFAPERGDGRERRGVWITAESIRLWWMVPAGLFSRAESGMVLKSTDISESVKALLRASGREVVVGAELGDLTRRALRLGVPFYLLGNCVAVMLPVMLYIWLFTLMAVLLRRGEVTGGFASVFAANVLCAVPAMCVAGVYASLRLPALDFHTVFILAFFLYITMAFASVRRMLAED